MKLLNYVCQFLLGKVLLDYPGIQEFVNMLAYVCQFLLGKVLRFINYTVHCDWKIIGSVNSS